MSRPCHVTSLIPLAKCARCKQRFFLRYDGVLSAHVSKRSWPKRCAGSHKVPAGGAAS